MKRAETQSETDRPQTGVRWLNRTVLGIGLASLFSDWSHETATSVLPAFLASIGAGAAWLGPIEGVSDGLSSFAKLASGHYTDRLARRKPIAFAGYVLTTLATGAIGIATTGWQVLFVRSLAWLGRGVRTPVRKALLAASVDRKSYGRAFGFERMMDTLGAIVGPLSALLLLRITHSHFPGVFASTLIPGFLAAAIIGVVVQEKDRIEVPHISFGRSLSALPPRFQRYLIAVGIFGFGDFAHTLLILLAAQALSPTFGKAGAATLAAGFYVLHNALYASFSFISGWLADRLDKRKLLAAGYFTAGAMAAVIIFAPLTVQTLVPVFVLGGIYVAVEETLEDSLCAEMVNAEQHGMAFGLLATVNGIGDFSSSLVVGLLWSRYGVSVAFGYSDVLFAIGALMVARLKPAASTS
jgi:MFS family permease